MSLAESMYCGVSGLSGNAHRLGVISDNVANSNTIGYKAVRADFATLMASDTLPLYQQPGGVVPVNAPDVARQGQIQSTTSTTDLAVAGSGFFIVRPSFERTDLAYTRAGNFDIDADGYMRSATGAYLQGFAADARGAAAGTAAADLRAIRVPQTGLAAAQTTRATVRLNLPADAGTAHATVPLTTSLTAYDNIGGAHQIRLEWTSANAASGQWTARVLEEVPMAAGAAAPPAPLQLGVFAIGFAPDGAVRPLAVPATFVLTPVTGAAPPPPGSTAPVPNTVELDFGGLTSLAAPFEVASITQDGAAAGQLSGLTVDPDGALEAQYTNGTKRSLYRIPLATFPNPNGLAPGQNSIYRETVASGAGYPYLAGTAGAGSIVSRALESSTVDIAEELTQMIVTQNAYGANAKVIGTVDELYKDILRLGA